MENKIIAVIILLAVLFFAGATTFIYWGSRILCNADYNKNTNFVVTIIK